ncbi:MAG: MSHA biogenesis protein MshE, partial [Methylococcales bacterium]|nr:MSHA biogenesis protein MshE [Methylococcales bacterium]
MEVIKKGSIGDLLLKNQIITEQQLQHALIEQKKTGKKLGRIFIELGFIEELKFLRILSQHLKIPLLDLTRYAKKSDII